VTFKRVFFDPDEVKIETTRVSEGAPFAVRATHLPTGFTVAVGDRESTRANHAEALRRLEIALATAP